MNTEEVTAKWESFKRTQKMLNDEIYRIHDMQNDLKFEMINFQKEIMKDGFIFTYHGWDKK